MENQDQDEKQILKFLQILWRNPGEVRELRIPHTASGTVSGYFDNPGSLAKAAEGAIPYEFEGVFVTLNPVNPTLIARAKNKLAKYAKHTTSDSDIVMRIWVLIDFDPARPSGISSTTQEHEVALEKAQEVARWLAAQGFPEPIIADSGNGSHLLLLINLPNDQTSTELLKRFLATLAAFFDDDRVKVDQTTYNAARISKIYGTWACKGDSMEDRPHRQAKLITTPDDLKVVPVELLEHVVGLLPKPEHKSSAFRKGSNGKAIDMGRWLEEHEIEAASKKPWEGGELFVLKTCPWNPEHTNQSAYIIQWPDGGITAKCHHNSCSEQSWKTLKKKYPSEGGDAEDMTAGPHVVTPTSAFSGMSKDSWPTPPAPVAFHGLAGEFVRLIEPHSEADPVAILVHFLVFFGNVIGRKPNFRVENTLHYPNLFAAVVGETSRGRKGTAKDHVQRVFFPVAELYVKERVKGGLSTGEGLAYAVRDPSEKLNKKTHEPEDSGVEDKRLLVIEPEFASALRVMARETNTLSAFLRQAWDSGNLRVLNKNSPVKATDAHISIITHITQAELLRFFTETDTANGFGNRFLWVCAKRSKLLPDGGSLDDKKMKAFSRGLEVAIQFAAEAEAMRRDEGARTLWHNIYGKLTEERPGLLSALTARAEAQVLRLSMIYALMDCSASIQKVHLEAALALWRYCDDSVKFIFGDRLGDPTADEILSALRGNPDGSTRTQISDLFGRNKPPGEIPRALSVLLKEGLANFETKHTSGRDCEIWFATAIRNEKNEKNEINEESPPQDIPLNSSNSFISCREEKYEAAYVSAEGKLVFPSTEEHKPPDPPTSKEFYDRVLEEQRFRALTKGPDHEGDSN